MLEKTELRKQFLAARRTLSPESHAKINQSVCGFLKREWETQAYDQVFAYLAFKGEVDLIAFLSELGEVGLPVIGDHASMEFHKWSDGEFLEKNRFGILEPRVTTSKPLIPTSKTLILVPAVAVDHLGYRLGYGGGYYDRYFDRYQSGGRGLGCVAAQFFVGELPRGTFDVQLAGCVTEEHLNYF